MTRMFAPTKLAIASAIALTCSASTASAQVSTLDLAKASSVIDPQTPPGAKVFTSEDHAFLDDLQKRGIQYFLDEADPETGLMPDRARAEGGHVNEIASIASVGFGLTCLVIGEERGWIPKQEAYDRAYKVLRFLRDHAAQERGHFYHFLNMRTGKREWRCEVSNIDTALLIAGALTVRQHFPDTELAKLCTEIYDRVEWPWLMTETGSLSMGWHPESGFIPAKWDHYSEGAPLILLLAMGSNTHPLPPDAWKKWKRDSIHEYDGIRFLQCPPLFTHQFPQCWFDLRGLRDDYVNYYRNSQLATIVMRQWMGNELSKQFPQYGPEFWGLTASDYKDGYTAWGGPPAVGPIDGSVVPAAAAGSLGFEPRICIDVLKSMKERYGKRAYAKYGFVDAFNPAGDWYNQDVIGIDVGPSVVMAENARTGLIWTKFMSSPEAQKALKAAGFRELTDAEREASVHTSLYDSNANK